MRGEIPAGIYAVPEKFTCQPGSRFKNMLNLNSHLQKAKEGHYAIGHFNFATADVLRGIIEAAKEAGVPAVMVGTSEGEAGFIGMKEAVALVAALRGEYDFPVFLNADHFKSFEKCKEAIGACYDSVIIDASRLPYHENIAVTKKVVDYAQSVNPDISVEGELGYLRGTSEVQRKIEISPADYTQPNLAFNFLSHTKVDRLAVVFGNIHGIVTEQTEKLDIEHLKRIVLAVNSARSIFHFWRNRTVYLVLHGASGLKDEDVVASIKAGIVNVHFNTELRVAYREGIEKAIHAKPDEAAPYKYLAPAIEDVKKVVSQKIKLFISHV